jgi:NifB/MoaA-like Fe-S oxidoreductase
LTQELKEKYGIDLEVRPVVNKWFGETVTVAGLITATDIIAELKNNRKYKDLIIPSTMLKEFEDVFLDGISLEDLKKELDAEVYISFGGESFIKILEGKQ